MRRHILIVIVALACCAPVTAFGQQRTIKLFNGKNLNRWMYKLFDEEMKLDEDAKMEDVWSVQDGILVCKGKPMGYLATKKKFKDFELVVEWRWAPGKDPGNSGVLLRICDTMDSMLPKCVEAQLKHESAGDIWAFQGFKVTTDSTRFREVSNPNLGDFMGVGKESGNENKPGEWNKYEITLKGGHLVLKVNGKKVNECTGCDDVAGHIGLQSEGGEIHFQTVKLTPIETDE
jgi:hypothetical protein